MLLVSCIKTNSEIHIKVTNEQVYRKCVKMKIHTCKELKKVKRYVITSVSLESMEKKPNVHVRPRIGSKTAAAFNPVLCININNHC